MQIKLEYDDSSYDGVDKVISTANKLLAEHNLELTAKDDNEFHDGFIIINVQLNAKEEK
jgi:hypothetical protein